MLPPGLWMKGFVSCNMGGSIGVRAHALRPSNHVCLRNSWKRSSALCKQSELKKRNYTPRYNYRFSFNLWWIALCNPLNIQQTPDRRAASRQHTLSKQLSLWFSRKPGPVGCCIRARLKVEGGSFFFKGSALSLSSSLLPPLLPFFSSSCLGAVVGGGVAVAMAQPCIVRGSPHSSGGPWMSPEECQRSRSFPRCTLPRLIPTPSHLHTLTPSSLVSGSVLHLSQKKKKHPSPPPTTTTTSSCLPTRGLFLFSHHCAVSVSDLVLEFVIILYLPDLGFYWYGSVVEAV